MKKLQIWAILVPALIGVPLVAQRPPEPVFAPVPARRVGAQPQTIYPVYLDVTARDPVTQTKIISAVSRELRKLGDISVVEDKPVFDVHIVAIETKNQAGAETGLAFAVTVAIPLAIAAPQAGSEGERWIDTFLFTGPDLDSVSQNAVAYIDTNVLAHVRAYASKD